MTTKKDRTEKGTKPRRIEYRPHPDAEKAKRGEKVKALFVDFKIIQEDWNIYELEDGTRARIRIRVREFSKALDPETEEIMYRGAKPVYGMEVGVETVIECPEELIWRYKLPASEIYELCNKPLLFRVMPHYKLTTTGDIEESTVDFSLIGEINPSLLTMVWGSACKHLRLPEEQPLEIVIEKEINVDNLAVAMNATDEKVNQWLGLLLKDYDIEPTAENIEATSSFIRLWLEQQALKSGVKLEEDELSKLFRFTVRLAYEALYVGSV